MKGPTSVDWDRGPESGFLGLSRRQAVGGILHLAALAHPLGQSLLAAGPASLDLAGLPDVQPFLAQVKRLVEAMACLGEPFPDAERSRIDGAGSLVDQARVLTEIQQVLDPRCLLVVRINPEAAFPWSAGRRRLD